MSSLSEQLKKIKETVSSSTTVDKKKHQAVESFCFPFKKAAEQSLNEVYDFSIEGFDALSIIEPRLRPFRKTLFAPSSISYDRYMQVW